MENTIDTGNMRQVITDFPLQLEKGLALAKDIDLEKKFGRAVVVAMGGSALAADIAKSLQIPVAVHKNYGLPQGVNQESLVICVSYSGNTEETVSALEEAVAKKIPAMGVASGGAIATLCRQ